MTEGSSEPTRAQSDAGIAAFWAWWPEARGRIEAAIPTQSWGDLGDEISARVSAIHPKIGWEMGSGAKGAKQMICLCPQGSAARRAITQRWFAAAPPADHAWEFHPARMAKAQFETSKLEIGGYTLALSDYRVGCREDLVSERFHVRMWHPEHPDMLRELQGEVVLVVLDGLLGEDDVERWIGSIELVDALPVPGELEIPEGPDGALEEEEEVVSLTELKARVKDLAGRATKERFCLLDAVGEAGLPMTAAINLALKRIDHVHAELHLEVAVTLKDPTEVGLAGLDEVEALGELEEELRDELGPDVAYLGKVTHDGRCVHHFFVPESSSVPGRAEAWRALHPERQIEVTLSADPTWSVQQQFDLSRQPM